MKQEELKKVLELHKKWLNNEEGGVRANLIDADLIDANLSSAILIRANLIDADLSDANLSGTNIPMYCKLTHSIIDDQIQIGCKTKTVDEWEQWLGSDEEFTTKRGTQEFKQIEAVIRGYIAYLTTLKS